MQEGLVDLHVHTTASDGTMSPKQLVKYAKQKGISALGITDHDTIAGIEEAGDAGKLLGVEVIPGIEISVDYKGEMHILGYYVKETPKFNKKLEEFKGKRNARNLRIIEKLRELGMAISWKEVSEAAGGETVGRPHIAVVLVNKGYTNSIKSTFEKYIGKGKKAYVERDKVEPKEGIELILEAGGIPVLAHPKYLNLGENQLNDLLEKLKDYGLLGIEAYYSMNTKYETGLYLRLAIKHGLITTGGTDFHGENKPEIDIGVGRGNMKLGYKMVQELKARHICL